MTTVAYRNGVLAADSLVTTGDTKLPELKRKVWKLRDGRLFGGAGDSETIEYLKASINDGVEAPKLSGVEAILVDTYGAVTIYEGKAWVRVSSPYVALGTGSTIALTAMWMGADAKTAVKAGIKFDRNSGGRVYAVKL
jgi:ATP-dependent protease HslVU (ClpYQ) peptidase subunit